MQIPWTKESGFRGLFEGRRGRNLRETLTAYLMIAPAIILIFIFGIFPVFFALYVSLHRWLIVRDQYTGIKNYVDALDNLAYIGIFVLGVGALIGAFLLLRKLYRQARATNLHIAPLALPAALHAAAVLAFVRWLYLQIPEFLDIANKMRGLERTRELFLQLIGEAFRAETVFPAWQQFVIILLLAVVLGVVAARLWRVPENGFYQSRLALFWLAVATGVGLLYFDFTAVNAAYAAALETGTDPGIWPQMIMVLSGVVLLVFSWRIWRSAEKQATNAGFLARLFAAVMLMVGAVLLIIEVPSIIVAGDQDMWDGLKVTVFFSLGTVPVQLAISLFLAILLFQPIKGSGIFRVIFFLPYVTPAVASATVFKLLFSDRESGPINRILQVLGMQSQSWLREPDGILSMLANSLGISGYPTSVIPAWVPPDQASIFANWLTGPSLALTVVIILSVWTFIGYNTVIYLAGLGNIPGELTEAAEIDGASRWDIFRHITFPLLSPTTYFLSLIGVMGTFKSFNTIWVLRTGQELGTINTFSVVIFEEFFLKTRYGYASALAFVLFAVILSLTYINNRVQGSRVFYG
jgi:multiple sugar transport system permease protein